MEAAEAQLKQAEKEFVLEHRKLYKHKGSAATGATASKQKKLESFD